MSRPLRIEYEGAVYHITTRGNQQQTIFQDDDDRMQFLEDLNETIRRYGWIVYAWCLMGNHYHLVLETPQPNLSAGMRQLNGQYTRHCNRRHGRVGHLFQGRFGAVLVEKDSYLLAVCRYAVLNPVRAQMVVSPEDWPWSSYLATASGSCGPHGILTVEPLLRMLDTNIPHAMDTYVDFIRSGIGRPGIASKKGPVQAIGSPSFVRELGERLLPAAFHASTAAAALAATRPPLAELFGADARHSRLQLGSRIVAASHLGYKLREIAACLGVHYTTVSRYLHAAEAAEASSP